jgi:hypothetical protein
MLLAGMVLSNLMEEKGNKVIEILAAAIPMESVFFGKLFAMLAISFVGIGVWAVSGAALSLAGWLHIPELVTPAVGWPLFIGLGVAYFAMAYLVLGSIFLAIGSMANSVREIQTLNMPVTMGQLMVFFFASYAMARPGGMVEMAAILVPFSSPLPCWPVRPCRKGCGPSGRTWLAGAVGDDLCARRGHVVPQARDEKRAAGQRAKARMDRRPLGKSDRLKLSPFRPRIEGKGRRTMQASRRHIVMGLFAGAAGP